MRFMKRTRIPMTFSLSFLILLTGCTNFPSVSQSSDVIEGGEHGLVRGRYTFNTFEEYRNFYDIFKVYNHERYWVPQNSDAIDIVYYFETVPISLEDLRAKRYDLRFKGQEMKAELNNDSIAMALQFEVLALHLANWELGDVSFAFEEGEEENTYDVSFSVKQAEVAKGTLTSLDSNQEAISDSLENLVTLFELSKQYVF